MNSIDKTVFFFIFVVNQNPDKEEYGKRETILYLTGYVYNSDFRQFLGITQNIH